MDKFWDVYRNERKIGQVPAGVFTAFWNLVEHDLEVDIISMYLSHLNKTEAEPYTIEIDVVNKTIKTRHFTYSVTEV
jgi:hypothetical protein